ncbi:hypothetical protein P3X46_000263 [Hevea brasiliensis]|uniref:RRM domain-containing protein n=1 Tax=Hevea brasiliensis TaxID=3981 RepID=A0ABQ9N8S6_HEVBR|nr:uncharacterized protein LOC110646519 [Hevea brasiliensis]XP_057999135.1 uncharacterized protein LOC110646519 [Hevea brasiliensis]XP_057999142.1 uncharacterized protein LOC110646519 [Hevea brasiliensis]KAJ9188911.1 hypothetical protein P3X46_000263 [Hevea brasiliensis]
MAFWVTLQQFVYFHSIDRGVYARLVIELGLDSNQAKKIVAFWYWLEREGYNDFIKNMLPLPNLLLKAFAMEAMTCLDCLNKEWSPKGFVDFDRNIPLMRCLVSQDFSLGEVYANRERAVLRIERFLKDTCGVFADIFPTNFVNGFQVQPTMTHGEESQVPKNPHCKVNGCHSQMVAGQEDTVTSVCHNDRTLFVTFSKGHPTSKTELRDLMTRKFGNCVEAIHMRIQPQPLFARVVLKSVSAMEKILGGKDILKFRVNGKDVWARRFVPKQDEPISRSL